MSCSFDKQLFYWDLALSRPSGPGTTYNYIRPLYSLFVATTTNSHEFRAYRRQKTEQPTPIRFQVPLEGTIYQPCLRTSRSPATPTSLRRQLIPITFRYMEKHRKEHGRRLVSPLAYGNTPPLKDMRGSPISLCFVPERCADA